MNTQAERERVDILIVHGVVLAHAEAAGMEIIEDGAVAIREDLILDVGKSAALLEHYQPDELIDASGDLIIPGLVNGHVHTMQTFARGLCDLDHPTRRGQAIAHDPMGNAATWAQNAWLIDSGLDDEGARLCAQLAIIEMIKSGTTTYADVCAFNLDVLAQTIGEMGIRVVLGKNTSDIRDMGMPLPDPMVRRREAELQDSIAFYERWNGEFEGRLAVWMGLHALWACSDWLCREIAATAQRLETGLSMHLTQTPGEIPYAQERSGGLRPVALMEKLGVLDCDFLAIHSAYLNEADIQMYVDHEVSIVHCPVAAMK